MFEGRHQEHLTENELRQLERFVREIQHRISLQLYGIADDDDSLADEIRIPFVPSALNTLHVYLWLQHC